MTSTVTAAPQTTDLEATDAEATDPGTANRQTADPEITDPETGAPAGAAAAEPATGIAQSSAAAGSGSGNPVGRAWRAWRRWRRRRPFWGGLFILLGGGEIILSERAPLGVIVHFGAQGMAGYLVPAIMVLCGLLLWVTPQQRLFYSLLALLMSLASWLTSNLGGFIIGMLLGLIGGSLAFAWSPRRR